MKRVLLAIALTLGFAGTTVAQQKVGHINVDELISVMPEYKAAELKFRNMRANWKAMLPLCRKST